METLGKTVAAFLVVVVVFLVVSTQVPGRSTVVQPLAYNHNLHVEQEGLVCIDCHVQVEERAAATLPPLEICEDCHDTDPLTESVEEAKLITYIENREEIPWRRLYEVPDHVYFSHRRHVSLGELACTECHGEVASQLEPAPAPEQRITMKWCMSCHKTRKVTNDCLACHR